MDEARPHPAKRELSPVALRARTQYARRVSGDDTSSPWWTAVVITASSARQAERYAGEIRRRRESGRLPAGVEYLVVPDPHDARIGSGGATLNALSTLVAGESASNGNTGSEEWWQSQRIFVIHSGGDSRRLPQYSLSGKLFSTLPVLTPWGDVSTVFDEMLALSSTWVAKMPGGLLVASGDVVLSFDASELNWDRPGVCGVAMPEPTEVGRRHGVFVVGSAGRVYSFLQKPTAEQVRSAGGLLDGDRVALDTGLFRFDAATAARLTALSESWEDGEAARLNGTDGEGATYCEIDLYQHFAHALTSEWVPDPDAPAILHELSESLADVPFHCDLVEGEFTHIGTTALFRELMTTESPFSRLYNDDQRVGAVAPKGVRSAGVIIDSMLAPGSELGPGALAIECDLSRAIRAGAGAILHGLTDELGLTEIPEDTVVHQVPIAGPDGQRGTVVRVYGVSDDPKLTVKSGKATWFGLPILEVLETLGIPAEPAWEGIPEAERSLWNAHLFPLGPTEEVGRCAASMLGQTDGCAIERWVATERLSLATSALWADDDELATGLARRRQLQWQYMALAMVDAGSDLRPLIVTSPGPVALARVGGVLLERAEAEREQSLTKAASTFYQASCFLAHAGLSADARAARASAFAQVQEAVGAEVSLRERPAQAHWQHDWVQVSAPARADLGGGWSDTPPFCIDWGGTVFNIALEINGEYPIRTSVRRLDEPLVRCVYGGDGQQVEYRLAEEVLAPMGPGSPFSIARAALQLLNLVVPGEPLEATLRRLGGGLEICTEVALPMGSGLGTSSILGATMLRALAEMMGVPLTEHELSDQVMCLEQRMTTGGGWQDQAGGIFPGAKLLRSGPGSRQRLRVEPVVWRDDRASEFADRMVLYYTGFQRIAKDLLAQVVGSYLARETTTVQVLHSIKTLADEMRYATEAGEWLELGQLIDRHWHLGIQMVPHMTNAPTNAILRAASLYSVGAKAAGAGGGGCLIILTADPDAAQALKMRLRRDDLPGVVYDYAIADEGLRVKLG